MMLVALAALAALPTPSAAEKGTSRLAVGIGQGVGDFVNPRPGTGALTVDTGDDPSQTEAFAEFSFEFAPDWALALRGAYGFFSASQEPDAAGSPTLDYTSSSFGVRAGVDRLGRVSDRLTVFLGPGLEYWSGRTEFKNIYGTTPPDDDVKSATTSRISISGRVGGILALSSAVGVVGQVGHQLGYATAEENGAKATWWPSHFNAALGLVFEFGGGQ
ncbi:MAG: hypothetical protein A2W00_11415 [Candidatus Eisenbacteria bacterium RBG_16_71_46]|nr:MAG: hypothetical protein A2W00_11415 [Candidatus Eisenbacteria bacterium RBG_16_71_46]